ncbi:MAG TPA: helix-hairpin-helix domain-containing protein [Candidatus Limnocylindrales bacterium]|nr:helix-hairpin-helix domain-containing protein [Candidatus Limnocylindrales bacterium]
MTTGNDALSIEWPERIGKVAARELARNGYTTYDRLTAVTRSELLRIHGIGPKAIRILDEELRSRGLSFALEEPSP